MNAPVSMPQKIEHFTHGPLRALHVIHMGARLGWGCF